MTTIAYSLTAIFIWHFINILNFWVNQNRYNKKLFVKTPMVRCWLMSLFFNYELTWEAKKVLFCFSISTISFATHFSTYYTDFRCASGSGFRDSGMKLHEKKCHAESFRECASFIYQSCSYCQSQYRAQPEDSMNAIWTTNALNPSPSFRVLAERINGKRCNCFIPMELVKYKFINTTYLSKRYSLRTSFLLLSILWHGPTGNRIEGYCIPCL